MFRSTNPQSTLGSLDVLLSPDKINRLESKHWAGPFRTKALPVLLENEKIFRPLFSQDNGRPNKPVAATLGVLILKEMFDLTDENALDNFEFNTAWQYALSVEPDDAHVCQKTLHNFRVKMIAAEDSGLLTYSELFDKIVKAIVEDLGLKVARQRLDSTHIRSNMAILTRLGLFTHTITAFIKKLHKKHPRLFAALPAGIKERYFERAGYFADSPSSKSKRRLKQCAADLWRLVDRFKDHRSVKGMPSYLRMNRLLAEQCIIEDGEPTDPDGDGPDGVPVRPKEPKTEAIPATSLQGSDEDATYGHKGKGYQAQVAETCCADNATEVVTHVSMEGAHESDQHATVPVLNDLDGKDCLPGELLADTNYGRGENIVEAADRGVSLLSPPCGRECRGGDDELTLDDFEFSADGSELNRCPHGSEPIEQGVSSRSSDCRYARLDICHCVQCGRIGSCPVTWRDGDLFVTLRWKRSAGATSARRRHVRTGEFKDLYRIRSGIEATNSEFKRRYGGGRLRVRGSPSVELAVKFKFMALNVRRWIGVVGGDGGVAPKTCCQAA